MRLVQLLAAFVGMVIFYRLFGTVEPSGYNVFGSLGFGFFFSYAMTLATIRVTGQLKAVQFDRAVAASSRVASGREDLF
jgi:hypothetical protein